jgi:hypothetical protein
MVEQKKELVNELIATLNGYFKGTEQLKKGFVEELSALLKALTEEIQALNFEIQAKDVKIVELNHELSIYIEAAKARENN